MPTVKEGNKQRAAHANMIRLIMQAKEEAARRRLAEIEKQQPELKKVWETYLSLYALHIKPLMPKVNQYWANDNEKRKLEHFLQGQAEHLAAAQEAANKPMNQTPGQRSWTLPPQVQKLPYAGKSEVGKKPKPEKALDEQAAKQLVAQIKALDPKIFDELLKKVGGK